MSLSLLMAMLFSGSFDGYTNSSEFLADLQAPGEKIAAHFMGGNAMVVMDIAGQPSFAILTETPCVGTWSNSCLDGYQMMAAAQASMNSAGTWNLNYMMPGRDRRMAAVGQAQVNVSGNSYDMVAMTTGYLGAHNYHLSGPISGNNTGTTATILDGGVGEAIFIGVVGCLIYDILKTAVIIVVTSPPSEPVPDDGTDGGENGDDAPPPEDEGDGVLSDTGQPA